MEQGSPAAEMIEHNHARRPVEQDLRARRRPGNGAGEAMGDVEADGPHQATGERDGSRKGPGSRCCGERLAQRIHQALHRPVGLHPSLTNVDCPPVAAHLEPVAEADERVAPDAVPVLHTLQEETRVQRAELQIHRCRRIEVCWNVEGMVQRGLLSPVRKMSSETKNPPSEAGGGS
jgi:hypothetical protein